jgi:signal transduction histidine kinase
MDASGPARVPFTGAGTALCAWDNRRMNPVELGEARFDPAAIGATRAAALGVAFVAAYVLLDRLSYIHPLGQYGITPWNPQPALAIALLMMGGRRWLPVVFAAAAGSEWIVRGAPGGWGVTLLLAAVLSLSYAMIAGAMSRRFAVGAALESRRDIFRLVGVVTIGTLVAGMFYVAALVAAGSSRGTAAFDALVRFWIGDSVGILVTLPPLLMACVRSRRAEMGAMFARAETLAYAAAIALALWLVFARPVAEQFKFFYVMFLPLVWVATRFGMVGAALTAAAIQLGLIVEVQLGAYQAVTVFELQAFLIALTVTGFFLGVAIDERRRAAEELRRSMRMAAAGEMAAALAHEINQPLTALATYARAGQMLARAQPPDPERLDHALDRMASEAARAGEVVRRLRDFFRTGATELRPASIAAIARKAVDAARARASESGIALECDGESGEEQLLDDVQMQVVLRNLLANALDAAALGPQPRIVRVEVRPDVAGATRVTVRDSGPGVARAEAERIFEPFETTRPSGMGMGLAISRAIVEAHGGRLWAEPGPQGVFTLTVPPGTIAHG